MKKEIIGYVVKCKFASILNHTFIEGEEICKGSDKFPFIKDNGLDSMPLFIEPVYKEPEFELWEWYKNKKGGLVFISGTNSGYGFDASDNWMSEDGEEWGLKDLKPATYIEVEERLLAYAKKHYPVGTKYKSANSVNEFEVKEQLFEVQPRLTRLFSESGKGCLLYDGKWAEIIQETDKDDKLKEVTDMLKEAIDKLNALKEF